MIDWEIFLFFFSFLIVLTLIPLQDFAYILRTVSSIPNVNKPIQTIETDTAYYIFFEKYSHSLYNLVLQPFEIFDGMIPKLFLFYQLVRSVNELHRAGIAHGNIQPRSILFEHSLNWISLDGFLCPKYSTTLTLEKCKKKIYHNNQSKMSQIKKTKNKK